MNRLIKLLPLVAIGAVTANAQVVIGAWYDFDDNQTAHVEAPDIIASDWTANLATSARGSSADTTPNLQSDDNQAGDTGSTFTTVVISGFQANLNGAAAATSTFTFTNNTGVEVNLANFHLDWRKASFSGTAGDPETVDWGDINLVAQSGVTGATDGATLWTTDVGTGNYTWFDTDVSLSGYSIAAGATATLTLVVVDNGTSTQAGWKKNIHYDNVSLTAVPEPSTYALLAGMATLGLVMIRRRR
jgi:hypothetical protein